MKIVDKHFTLVVSSISGIITFLVGFYIERLSNGMSNTDVKDLLDAIGKLGSWNLLLLSGIILFVLQIWIMKRHELNTQIYKPINERKFIEDLLETAISFIKLNLSNGKDFTIRGLITVFNEQQNTRVTYCGFNIRADPEFKIGVPSGFGVSGRAFTQGHVVFDDLPTDHKTGYTREMQSRICEKLRSVVAAPLRNSNGRIIGTINFDSFQTSKEVGFDRRECHETIGLLAEIIGPIIAANQRELSYE